MSKKFAELEVNKSFKFAQPAGGKEEGVFKKIEEINKKGKTAGRYRPYCFALFYLNHINRN